MKAYIIYDESRDLDEYVCQECKQQLEGDPNYTFNEVKRTNRSYADSIECGNCNEVLS